MIVTINPEQSITETIKKLSSKDILILEDGIYNEKLKYGHLTL